jgi:hypothetical protein
VLHELVKSTGVSVQQRTRQFDFVLFVQARP